MIDIKIRNVKVEHMENAIRAISYFMKNYSYRVGANSGVGYSDGYTFGSPKLYVYRTKKTVICVGDYGSVDK